MLYRSIIPCSVWLSAKRSFCGVLFALLWTAISVKIHCCRRIRQQTILYTLHFGVIWDWEKERENCSVISSMFNIANIGSLFYTCTYKPIRNKTCESLNKLNFLSSLNFRYSAPTTENFGFPIVCLVRIVSGAAIPLIVFAFEDFSLIQNAQRQKMWRQSWAYLIARCSTVHHDNVFFNAMTSIEIRRSVWLIICSRVSRY